MRLIRFFEKKQKRVLLNKLPLKNVVNENRKNNDIKVTNEYSKKKTKNKTNKPRRGLSNNIVN